MWAGRVEPRGEGAMLGALGNIDGATVGVRWSRIVEKEEGEGRHTKKETGRQRLA